MFGNILFIGESIAHVENKATSAAATDLMNLHVIFESGEQKILGEVSELNKDLIKIRLLGEYVNGKYLNGILRKPLLNSQIRIINSAELLELVGQENSEAIVLGNHAIYKGFKVVPKLNSLFANHLAIFGNSGSGKSYGTTRIMQNIFNNKLIDSIGSNIIIFDSFGEYRTSFSKLNEYNQNYHYKFITSNITEPTDLPLEIPLNLLTVDDFALLLQAESHAQLPIIEHTVKLAKIFSLNNEESNSYKNHLIAKALIAILFSNETIQTKKNEIFKVIEVCHTTEMNFDAVIPGMGYTRSFSECFEIDSRGQFGESVLITDYILTFIKEDHEAIDVPKIATFDLKEFQSALEFTLISEGFLHNETLYDIAIILKVRLNAIINSNINSFFVKTTYDIKGFVNNLTSVQGNKAQVININLEEVDDHVAKVIVKIYSRLLFQFSKANDQRASVPFHLFLEEAHRYVQNDKDTFLIGYNIFDRIAKEGRKYGILLNIISQRPVEMSETVISQISNFLIFKMTHPKDIKYIEEMLPGVSADILEKQKTLQPGTCVAFGSAFKIPMIVKLDLPDPAPYSSSCDVTATWKTRGNITTTNSIDTNFVPPNINPVGTNSVSVNISNQVGQEDGSHNKFINTNLSN